MLLLTIAFISQPPLEISIAYIFQNVKKKLQGGGLRLQIKLNPSSYPDEVGFHHEVISSHDSGIYSVCKDGFCTIGISKQKRGTRPPLRYFDPIVNLLS